MRRSERDSTIPAFGSWADGRVDIKALVVVNEHAGSVGPGGRKRLLAEIKALGCQAIRLVSEMDDLCAADAAGADLIIVLGGDGTARKALEVFSVGPPLLLLPGGTLNLVSHALCGQLAWPQALRRALRQARVARLTGGEANGRKFFIAAMFGAPTLLARAREAARSWRLGLMVARLSYAFRRILSRRLAVRPAGAVASRAEAVGVLCPAYSGEVEGQALEWVRLDGAKILDFVRLGLRSVIGGWREDSSIQLSLARGGEIRSVGMIPAVLDGEPTVFLSHVRVRMLSEEPKVLFID